MSYRCELIQLSNEGDDCSELNSSVFEECLYLVLCSKVLEIGDIRLLEKFQLLHLAMIFI